MVYNLGYKFSEANGQASRKICTLLPSPRAPPTYLTCLESIPTLLNNAPKAAPMSAAYLVYHLPQSYPYLKAKSLQPVPKKCGFRNQK